MSVQGLPKQRCPSSYLALLLFLSFSSVFLPCFRERQAWVSLARPWPEESNLPQNYNRAKERCGRLSEREARVAAADGGTVGRLPVDLRRNCNVRSSQTGRALMASCILFPCRLILCHNRIVALTRKPLVIRVQCAGRASLTCTLDSISLVRIMGREAANDCVGGRGNRNQIA